MQYTEVVYSRTVNKGNYESEKIELRAAIEETDNADEVVRSVMVKAAEILGVQPPAEKITKVEDNGNVEVNGSEVDPGTGKKVAKKAKKAKKVATKKTAKKKVEEEIEAKTLEDVKTGLKDVWKKRGKEAAVDILKDFGVKRSDDLPEDVYGKVYAECMKCVA